MLNRTVVWIDDEPALMDAELFDLENHRFEYQSFQWVGDALTWLTENRALLNQLPGIVVDVQLPSRGDTRFTSSEGVPVGVKFCECLREDIALWDTIKNKVILYTRLPQTSIAAESAKKFAATHGVRFYPKTASSRVAIELIKNEILTIE
ncbi:MAG: hypothetical protein KJZ64_00110 [Sphingomonadaceae bacterium]|nr:hypothetical protein [Sphingomonadaceae bacterium]